MKTVFTNRQMAHVWAQLSQPFGRSGSMCFGGGVGYSYQTPVAHILRGPRPGERVALLTSAKYSVTTSSKHMPAYRDAVRGIATFTVPNLLIGREHIADFSDPAQHEVNLAYFASEYASALDKMRRCPAGSYWLRDPAATLRELSSESLRYCNAFGIPVPACPWLIDADKAIARRDRLLNDPRRAARLAAAEATRVAAVAERARLAALSYDEKVEAWRNGANIILPYFTYEGTIARGDLLRIKGQEVQTQRGATVPLVDALRAMKLWRKLCVGATWIKLDHVIHYSLQIGDFVLHEIDTNGNMIVGCHTFMREELERFETLLASAS